MMIFPIVFVVLILVMQSYFFVADRFNIIDKPNNRSSHTLPTIRGGGIIFLMGLLLWFFSFGFEYPYLVAGAVLIAAISFMDDVREQPAALRLVVHLAAFLLLGWQLALFFYAPWWLVVVIFIIAVGTLNAFNFMDGINGITGVYTFVALATLLAIDHWIVNFTSEQLVMVLVISVLVFLIYNFRKKRVALRVM
jgi:UDP-N-acetylmuramyl pentapeptide phosphotransferase/UDP-N-acetylglucosamine-1-phosphate transferase